MAVVISEIITETAVAPAGSGDTSEAPAAVPDLDLVVRRATERVLETLRREWDR